MSVVHLHLLLNHVPVVGVIFVAFVLLAALRMRSSDVAKLAFGALAAIAVVTGFVFLSGEPAEEAVENVAGVSEAVIHAHEEAAEAALIAAIIAGVLAVAALLFYRKRELPRWLTASGLIVVLGVSGLMAWTANLGGQIRHSEIRSASATAAGDARGERGESGERGERAEH